MKKEIAIKVKKKYGRYISNKVLTNNPFIYSLNEQLELECRQNIVSRALKFSRQQSGKQKLAAGSGSFTADWAAEKIQQYLRHLQSLESDGVQALLEYDKVNAYSISVE